jgi:hypothetical protein
MLMFNCCVGFAGLTPVVPVPFAVTVNVAAPAGVVCATGGSGGGVEPPPQLASPATITNTKQQPNKPDLRGFLFFPTRNTRPRENGAKAQIIAYTGLSACGVIKAACGPVVFTVSIVVMVGIPELTAAVAGAKVHVVSAGRLPQLKVTVPVNPFNELVVMLNVAACPASKVAEVLSGTTE